jgi:hypothetical protein
VITLVDVDGGIAAYALKKSGTWKMLKKLYDPIRSVNDPSIHPVIAALMEAGHLKAEVKRGKAVVSTLMRKSGA